MELIYFTRINFCEFKVYQVNNSRVNKTKYKFRILNLSEMERTE